MILAMTARLACDRAAAFYNPRLLFRSRTIGAA
jgi:hypothetical protein